MSEKKPENRRINKMQINEKITSEEFQVISENNENLGIMKRADALNHAKKLGLDLVSINLTTKPQIYKILNYDHYRYELKKKEKQKAKIQRESVQKEKTIGLSVNIGQHDLETKIRNAMAFLKNGDKVKVEIRFRGRQIQHAELGISKIKFFCDSLDEYAILEKKWNKYKLEGIFFRVILVPINKKAKKSKSTKSKDGGDNNAKNEIKKSIVEKN